MLSEQVYHPDHYNLPGRKECIVEMEEKFGVKETFHFELLNAYKYIYRAGEKAGAEKDIEKAKNYFQMAVELIKKHPVELRPEMEVFRKLEKEIAPVLC